MKEKVIEIQRDLVDYIEGLQYEVDARRDIITFMLSNNMDTSSDAFERYHLEYQEFVIQYREAKKQLEDIFITDELKKEFGCVQLGWNLDFESGKLTVRGNAVEKE